jgi:hypothetical protein
VFANAPAWSQATQGSIVGVVKDSRGALIPGATVTLVNIEAGVSRTTSSTAAGDYSFLDSVAGHYTLTVEAAGFEKFQAKDLALTVRQQLRVDAKLTVGAVQQQVEVSGDSVSAIQTETPTISGTFSSDEAQSLPVNTRASSGGTSAANIFSALPGVQADASGLSLQGALPFQLDVTVDGATTKSAGGGSYITDAFPSTEAIAEIRADGVLANAEYANPAQIVVTTKGGSNKFHGSAFIYYQDNNWNAHAYSNTPYTQPSFHGTTFGGSFGGPVVIPHLYNGHNKSFFFVDYEGWRFPAQAVINEVVPTAGMKNGDFSGYLDASGNPIALRDPYTLGSWGTQLPTGNISQIASNVLKQFYPDPNIGNPNTYKDGQTYNYTENVDASKHSDQFDVRGDKYFGSNQKFLLWGRYTQKNFPVASAQQLLLPSSTQVNTNKVLKVDTNWSIIPSLINEGSYSFTRNWSGSENPFDGHGFTEAQGFIGLQNLFFNGLPYISFGNLQGLTAGRLSSLGNSITNEYQDTLIWTRGRHTMKFGGRVQTIEARSALGFFGADNYGSYGFNECGSGGSSGCFTGIDFADFLLGIPGGTEYDVVSQDNDGVVNHYDFFGQDDWRVSDRLTLSFGLRYELHPGYYDKGGDIGNIDPTVGPQMRIIYMKGYQSLLAQNYLSSANACDPDGINNTNNATVNGAACMPVQDNDAAGFPIGLKKYSHLRFMPRLGFAFRPFANDKTAIRGGFGMYNINLLGSNFYSLTGTIQAATQEFANTLNCTSATTCKPNYQWPQVYAGSGNGGPSNAYGTDYFGTANSVNWKDPYTYQWSLSFDQDLGNGYAARASYIGSESHQLVWAPDENATPFSNTVSAYNQPFSARLYPNWGTINTRAPGANESYHSLQLEASHRLQHGLQYTSTFTWAHALADNQGPDNGGFGGESGGARAESILDRHADFGEVFGTRRLRWNTTGLYDLPIGRGKAFGGSMNRVANLLAGGWRLTGIFVVQTGDYLMPYFPGGQMDPSGTGSGLNISAAGWTPTGRTQYADYATGVSPIPHGRNRTNWTNPAAFACPGDPTWQFGYNCSTGAGFDATTGKARFTGPGAASPLPIGRFGNAGNGSVEGPGLVNLSAGMSKAFAITEGVRFKVEGTFTNVLNHTNLGSPNLNLTSDTFGLISGAIGFNPNGASTPGADFGGARTLQVAARLEF